MGLHVSDADVAAFEKCLYLWQRMLDVSGVKLPKRRLPAAVEDEIRESMTNCSKCGSKAACTTWLATAEDETSPPKFCLNREIFVRLKAA
ncbi:DUF6455 family protein [Aestuariicoccus sp. MJ-SS9]|uniref:DUF6455 family protein n=1 Tax=Aestuariicoccus sp. MJ-SS9 TaxID=3079855 RepID=UPI002914AB02|nr:DUF6455 family protein [Aestuariicoccus sp. MJ-SS9]MDU8912255.1 DUF6455 family protein [Aestuariicoccus sp. MJ-SS9]